MCSNTWAQISASKEPSAESDDGVRVVVHPDSVAVQMQQIAPEPAADVQHPAQLQAPQVGPVRELGGEEAAQAGVLQGGQPVGVVLACGAGACGAGLVRHGRILPSHGL
jgi:hypothetical protein